MDLQDPQRRRFLQGTAIALGTTVASSSGVAAEDNSDSEVGIDPEEVSTARSADGMVASVQREATQAGVEVLENGGNAIDAAAAVQLALNVTDPSGSGIGGGSHLMMYSAEDDHVFTMEGYNPLPAAAHPELYLDDQGEPLPYEAVADTGLSTGVPGTLRLLDRVLKRYGSKYFDEVAQPAIKLAEDGFEVSAELADDIASAYDTRFSEAAQEVFGDGDNPLEEGDLLIQEDLASTLSLISEGGSQPFYQGEIGKAFAKTVQEHDGVMTFDDLRRYNTDAKQPLWIKYKDIQFALQPPSAWGGQALAMDLKLVEPFDFSRYDPRSAEKYHQLIETFHLVTSDIDDHFTDDRFMDIPHQGLVSDDYLEDRRELIDPDQTNLGVESGDPWAYQPGEQYQTSGHTDFSGHSSDHNKQSGSSDGNTTHLTVADSSGNIVALNSTLSSGFGTGIMVPDYGFMINNSNHKMEYVPGGTDEVQPGKDRPSGMAPTIAFKNGKPFLTVGGAGGDSIHGTVFQVILNVIEHDMDLPTAFAEPRVYHDSLVRINEPPLEEHEVAWEEGIPEDTRNELLERGHPLSDDPSPEDHLQAIMVEDNEYIGVGSPRGGGYAEGL